MLALVTGGSASGKSGYAENLLCKTCKGDKLYIAAMQPVGASDTEFWARVARHRALRAGKGFLTVERYTGLAELPLTPCGGMLLECLSNLTANELFPGQCLGEGREFQCESDGAVSLEAAGPCEGESAEWRRAYNAILRGVEHLCEHAEAVVVVTNEVFSDGCGYEEATLGYIRLLGALNTALAARADYVVEVVCGIPAPHKNKGGWPL